ncbi:DUF3530 family protein, partial [Pseudoalteromonas aliena]|uniref:DUF3530 family protein n=1 Tax=Pseudoalteromonas aliena TaxID=247523 RepID=UPI0031202EA3
SMFSGVVLLIPDWDSTATNNTGMNFLRKELNNLGYTTYAMTVPDIEGQTNSIDNTSPSNTAPPADAKTTSEQPVKVKTDAPPHFVDAI